MTIIAGFSSSESILLVADSRLSVQDTRSGEVRVSKDVCQKILPMEAHSAVGFSGDLLIAQPVLKEVIRRSRDKGTSWLLHEEEVAKNVQPAYAYGCSKAECSAPVSFIVGLIDFTRSVFRGMNVPAATLVSVHCHPFSYEKITLGFDIHGSGSAIRDEIDQKKFVDFLNFAFTGSPKTQLHGALGIMHILRSEAQIRNIDTVGGLYQIVRVSRSGFYPIEYEYWMDVSPGKGTFVSMHIEEGQWVQEHKPTKRRIVLEDPTQIDLHPSGWRASKMFDPRIDLSGDSPGVVERTNPTLIARVITHDG